MSAPKDTYVAMDVQQMAAYGYFQEEFLFYCYAFKRDEQIVYKLSESLLAIYDAYHNSVFDDVYPTPVCSLLQGAVVPAGEQITIKTQFKMELIQNMRILYGQPFFDTMRLFQAAPPQDTAYAPLAEYLQQLAPQAEKRQLFDGLCQQALEAKLLSPARYQELSERASRLYGQPQPQPQPLAGRGKTFSGFAYWPNAVAKASCYISATLAETYSKYHKLLQRGYACSPIIQKSYWYNSPNDFKAIRQAFSDFLQALLAESQIVRQVDALRALPSVINPEHYRLAAAQLAANATPEACAALASYGCRYHLPS